MDFLQRHPAMEAVAHLDSEHVIIDKVDWETAQRFSEHCDTIVLSERNLLTLLHRINLPKNDNILHKPHQGFVKGEPDDVHYAGRKFGIMQLETEAFIQKMKPIIKMVRQLIQDGEPILPAWAMKAAVAVAGYYDEPCGGCTKPCAALNDTARLITTAYRAGCNL